MKRILFGIGAILLILVIVFVVVRQRVSALSDPGFLVRHIEESLNCRAEIKDAELKLFGGAPTLSLTSVAFGPRDPYADQAIPLEQRPALRGSQVFVDFIQLKVEFWPLMRRDLVVKSLIVEKPQVDLTIYEDGTTSLDRLVRPLSKVPGPAGAEGEAAAGTESTEEKTFTASDLPLAAVADRIEIDRATIYATIEKSKMTVQVHDVIVIFTDIHVDPRNLAESNSAQMEFSASVAVDSLKHNMRFVDIVMDGNGSVEPFEIETGELRPSMEASVTVNQNSFIDAMPMLDEMEDEMEKLAEYGVKMEGVRLRGDFSEDTTASFKIHRNHVKMTSDFMVPIDENFIVLQKGSWADIGKNDHEFFVTFIASERLTTKAETEIEKYLTEKLGSEELAKRLTKEIMGAVKTGDFMVLSFASEGDFGDPELDVTTNWGTMDSVLEGAEAVESLKEKAKGLLEDLLK